MTNEQPLTKAELLPKIEQGWNDFNAYLMTLTPPQVTVPTDAAGWTALDHVIHLADWENGVLALLNKGNRAAAMGVNDKTWAEQDFDKINDILQKKSKNKTLEQARTYVMSVHQQFVDKIQSLSDEDLQRPYQYYQSDSDRTAPVINWIQMNTYNHYAEHMPWIAAIVAKSITKADLLAQLQKGWNEINTFLDGLTDEQKTQLTDAAGWTVKDHVIHMAAWEDGFSARMDKKDPRTAMDIDEATWQSGDDPINAVIQKRYQNLTWDQVIQKRQAIHDKLLGQIDAMPDATLQAPYNEYNPTSKNTYAINQLLGSSTFSHYADHLPWMKTIAAGKSS